MRARLLALALVPLLALTACGGGDSDDKGTSSGTFTGLDGVTVKGDFGDAPTVTAKKVAFDDVTVETISEGDGPAASKDKSTLTSIGIWSGVDGKSLLSWSADTPFVVNSSSNLIYGLADIIDGVTEGSRVVFAIPVKKAIDPSTAEQLGLTETDNLIGVIDVTGSALSGPEGDTVAPAAGTPTVVETDGKVTGFSWDGVGDAPTTLQTVTLVKGKGDPVKADQKVVVNYLGQVFKTDTVFDQSYNRSPAAFPLTKGGLIDGWVEGLQGVPVGSRVVLVIPPDKGYGNTASQDGQIPAGSTLVFVVDVLAAVD